MATISDTQFTTTWLEEILNRESTLKSKIQDFSATEIGFGRGFASRVLIVKLDWDNPEKLPKSVVLKIPSTKQYEKGSKRDNQEKEKQKLITAMYGKMIESHECEVSVYETFEKSKPPSSLKIPKCYLALRAEPGKEGVLVLEDLSRGLAKSFMEGITWDEVKEAAEQIAILQAYSLKNSAWREANIDNGFNKQFTNPLITTYDKIATSGMNTLKENYPETFGPLAEKALKLFQSRDDFFYVASINEKLGLPDVFVQGDFHVQNMMFNTEGGIRGILDWQFSHPGNIMEDIVRLLVTSVNAETRRTRWVEVVEHYYKSLREELGSDPPFSFEKVVESYKRAFKSCVNTVMTLFSGFIEIDEIMKGYDKAKVRAEMHANCKALLEDTIEYEAQFS